MILDILGELKNKQDFEASLDISPYAKMMGFRLMGEADKLTTVMKFHDDMVGAPFPPSLHGGTVAAAMEMAAAIQLIWDMDLTYIPKTIDITIDYLRSGKPEDVFVKARIYRQGRRFATLHTEAWQSDSQKPIATAMLHFQLI